MRHTPPGNPTDDDDQDEHFEHAISDPALLQVVDLWPRLTPAARASILVIARRDLGT